LCLRLAQEIDAEILSCDSLQVYEGMDIGTAKPTTEEMATVTHHGIDVFPVGITASVHAYSQMAAEAVRDIHARGKAVLVGGGSGFYLKSFLEPVCDEVSIPEGVRSEVADLLEEVGLEGLVERLLELNPEGLGELDLRNPRRVVPALERCMVTGKTVLQLRSEMKALPEPYADMEKRICVLERGDGSLKERIAKRTRTMLDAGLVGEVAALLEQGLRTNLAAANAIGYRETVLHLDGVLSSEAELEETI
ncbi:uncharacterized protein METZ01_LOCUS463516, partial [marine metagenome]